MSDQDINKIAIVSYRFFPDVTSRAVKLVSMADYFKGQGREVVFITVSRKMKEPYTYEGYNVYPISPRAPAIIQKILSNLGLLGWLHKINESSQVKTLAEIIDADCILSLSNPLASHVIGHQLRKQSPKRPKWFAQLRDPIIENPMYGVWQKVLFARWEYFLANEADIVMIGQGYALTKEKFLRRHPKAANKVVQLPYLGVDSKILHDAAAERDHKSDMVIGYAGSLLPTEGAIIKMEIFCRALARCNLSACAGRARLLYAGNMPDFLTEMIKRHDLERVFEYVGFLGKEELEAFYRRCDAFLLVQDDSNTYKKYVYSKFWEYVQTCKPIITFGHRKGTLSDIFSRFNLGCFVHSDHECEKYLQNLFNDGWDHNDCESKDDIQRFIQIYSRDKYHQAVLDVLS